MKKVMISFILMIVLSSVAIATDYIVFSGEVVDDEPVETIGGSVSSCGNDICQSAFGEDYFTCPTDCIIYFNEPELIDSKIDGLSNNDYSNGWSFRFDLDFYSSGPVYFGFKLDDFVDNGHNITIDGNVKMEYNNKSGDSKVLNIGNEYVYTDEIEPSEIVLKVKLPVDTFPSVNYISNYYWRLIDEI